LTEHLNPVSSEEVVQLSGCIWLRSLSLGFVPISPDEFDVNGLWVWKTNLWL